MRPKNTYKVCFRLLSLLRSRRTNLTDNYLMSTETRTLMRYCILEKTCNFIISTEKPSKNRTLKKSKVKITSRSKNVSFYFFIVRLSLTN